MVLVGGYSGIGKSALVQEIYKTITHSRGYFIAGKFDQYQRNIPDFAIAQAFKSLIKQLLTESEVQLMQWRKKLLTALGANSRIISQIIPSLELILGNQPDVPILPPTEAQNRFNQVFQNFIRVFTQSDYPLVIFLDDLQWSDSASLKLLQLFMNEFIKSLYTENLLIFDRKIGNWQYPGILSGQVYDEEIRLPQMQRTNFQGGLFYFYLNKLFLCYLFDDLTYSPT